MVQDTVSTGTLGLSAQHIRVFMWSQVHTGLKCMQECAVFAVYFLVMVCAVSCLLACLPCHAAPEQNPCMQALCST
jgi:hypothetical protein